MAAIALAALAMAVPTGASAGTAAPAQAGQTTAPQVPVLRWQACDDGFQCATARVPLDYRHPDAAKISIAVIRHLATDPAQRLGTMFVNLGGPMDQIEPFVSGFTAIPAQLRARYDIVSFDPRGFGFSTAIRCFPSVTAENNFLAGLPPFPVGAQQDAAWERTYARFDALCAQRSPLCPSRRARFPPEPQPLPRPSSPPWRRSCSSILVLDTQDDMHVVGEASDGAPGLDLARAKRPDVVLMDVRMPGMDGIEATRRMVSGVSTTRVLILTTFDLDEYAYAGLRGYGPPPANLGILIMASAFRLAEQDEIPHMSLRRHVLIRDGGRRR